MSTAFIIKKWLAALLLPLPLALIISLIGLGLILKQHTRRGLKLILLAMICLSLLSTRPVANALIRPLEADYAPHLVANSLISPTAIKDIVVLGAAQVNDERLPLLSQLGNAGLVRITEAVHLAQAYPEARLIVSGYGGGEGRSSAELYSLVAQSFGIDSSRILELPLPQNTAQEAAIIAPLIKDRRALLVTSASHMPRAMGLFYAQGARPFAAPVGHLAKESRAKLPLYAYLPSAHYLARSETAWREHLSIAWMVISKKTEQ